MSTKLPGTNPTAYLGIKETNPPQLYFRNRAPTNDDAKPYDQGDIWIDQTALEAYILVLKIGAVATWVACAGTGAVETLTGDTGGAVGPDGADNINLLGNPGGTQITGNPGTNTLTVQDLRNITKYVVDPTPGETEYQTIQSAIDAANAAGDNFIFVRNGTYVENLTLFPGVSISGPQILSSYPGSVPQCLIQGTHTPPTTSSMTFNNITLQSATDCFSSVAAGTAELNFTNCAFNITNGYALNIPNWTGIISFWDSNCELGTDDGCINNPTGGAPIFCYEAGLGNGSANTMQISGMMIHNQGEINCPVQFNTGSMVSISNGSFFQTMTTTGNAYITINHSLFETSSNIAITHNSTNPLALLHTTIDSTAIPNVITGTGTIQMGSIVFLNNNNLAGTLTQQAASYQRGGPIEIIPEDATVAAEDAWTRYAIPSGGAFSHGIDNSDSDSLKITSGIDPSSGTEFWKMFPNGTRTLALQPVFLAKITADINNITGNAVTYTVIFDNEVYDIGNNYNNVTGIFTAPITGIYLFESTLGSHDYAAGNVNYVHRINVPTKSSWNAFSPSSVFRGGYPEEIITNISNLVRMTAGQTAKVSLRVDGGAQIIDINSSVSSFSGYLLG